MPLLDLAESLTEAERWRILAGPRAPLSLAQKSLDSRRGASIRTARTRYIRNRDLWGLRTSFSTDPKGLRRQFFSLADGSSVHRIFNSGSGNVGVPLFVYNVIRIVSARRRATVSRFDSCAAL